MADAPEKKAAKKTAKKASSAKKKSTTAAKKAPVKKKASSAKRTRQPSQDEIAQRAYAIHESEGGHHEDNWHRAERELKGEG